MFLDNRQLRSSLEAEVDLILPSGDDKASYVLELLQREGMSVLSNMKYAGWLGDISIFPPEDFLKTLFIVSNVAVTDEGSLGTSSPEWLYCDYMSIPSKQTHFIRLYHSLISSRLRFGSGNSCSPRNIEQVSTMLDIYKNRKWHNLWKVCRCNKPIDYIHILIFKSCY